MSSLQSMIGTLPGYIICFAFMLLTGVQLAVLLRTFREKHGKARLIIALLHFLLGAFCLSVFLDYTYNVILTQYFGNVHPFE